MAQQPRLCINGRGKWSNVILPSEFLLRASLGALRSLVGFTPGIKHFGFTFSFNTSSSSRVVCYTFNCSSFEFSSPRLVPLQHQYLVILLLLLIANTCQFSSAANSGTGLAGDWGEFAAKIYVHGETFGKLIRRFTQELIPVSKPEAEAAVPPVPHKAALGRGAAELLLLPPLPRCSCRP